MSASLDPIFENANAATPMIATRMSSFFISDPPVAVALGLDVVDCYPIAVPPTVMPLINVVGMPTPTGTD